VLQGQVWKRVPVRGEEFGEGVGGQGDQVSRGGQAQDSPRGGDHELPQASQDPAAVGRLRSPAQDDPRHGIVSLNSIYWLRTHAMFDID